MSVADQTRRRPIAESIVAAMRQHGQEKPSASSQPKRPRKERRAGRAAARMAASRSQRPTLPAGTLPTADRQPRRQFVQKYPDSSNLRAGRNATARRFIQTIPDWSHCRARELNGYARGVESVKSSLWLVAAVNSATASSARWVIRCDTDDAALKNRYPAKRYLLKNFVSSSPPK